ncbi:protein capicua homolog [Amia ocellicauda]|uniref:protein capicua homolog n=1 Tax=Amia ocellicauda TaxID=2972642 RepID=UPI003463C1CB
MKPLRKQGGRSPPSTRAKGGKRRGTTETSVEGERRERMRERERERERETTERQAPAPPPHSSPRRHNITAPAPSPSQGELIQRGGVAFEGEGPDRTGLGKVVGREEAEGREGEEEEKESRSRCESGNISANNGNNTVNTVSVTQANTSNQPASRKTATFKSRAPKKKYTYEHCVGLAGVAGVGAAGSPPPPISSSSTNYTSSMSMATAGPSDSTEPQNNSTSNNNSNNNNNNNNSQDSSNDSPSNEPPPGTSDGGGAEVEGEAEGEGEGAPSSVRSSSTDTASEHSTDLEPPRAPAPPPSQYVVDTLCRRIQNQRVLARLRDRVRGEWGREGQQGLKEGEGAREGGRRDKDNEGRDSAIKPTSVLFCTGTVQGAIVESEVLAVQLFGEKEPLFYSIPFPSSSPFPGGMAHTGAERGGEGRTGVGVDLILDSPPPGLDPVAVGTRVCVPLGGVGGTEEAGVGAQLYREGVVSQFDPHPAVSFPYRVTLCEEEEEEEGEEEREGAGQMRDARGGGEEGEDSQEGESREEEGGAQEGDEKRGRTGNGKRGRGRKVGFRRRLSSESGEGEEGQG